MSRRFSWRARGRSFRHAGRGLRLLLASQHNAWIHAGATVAVVAAGLAVGLARWEWGLIVAAIGAVWVAEGLNTAVERLGDAVSAEEEPLVGRAKDAAAGAVLLAALAAAAIGLLVFLPRLWG